MPQDPISAQLANPHDAHLPPSKLSTKVQLGGLGLFGLMLTVTVFFSLTEHWRKSSFLFGISLLLLAALRLICDSRYLGVLAVRSRRFDVAFEVGLALAMIYLSISIDALGS